METLRIGTAGWSVPSRHAAAFPAEGTHLQRYAQRLNAVEINTSFYRPHQLKTYEKWAASVPPDFKFAVKVPKAISHERKLVDCDDILARFLDEAAGLGDKLGVLLVQLPPRAAFDAKTAEAFFKAIRKLNATPVALEPRHASWFVPDVDRWLQSRRIARVAADPAPVDGAGEPGGWNGLCYYRWHGSPRTYYSDYDAAALESLHRRLKTAPNAAWCIFDNTASGAALGNALTLSGA